MIDLIVNRRARLYARDAALIDRVAEAARGRCTMHVTDGLDALDEVVKELSRRGTDLVLLSGGDGTLMAGASALYRHFPADALPPIAPIAGGTACTVSRNWGLHGETVSSLERMLMGPRRLALRPTLFVRDDACERIGFILGTGLVARFFELYYQDGAHGYLGSAKLVARIFAESFVGGAMARRVLEPLPCSLEVDGERQAPEAWSLICAAVVPNLGIHMLLTYRGGEDPQRPHLVATPMRSRQLGPRLPRVLAGKSLGGPDHVDALTPRFSLRFPNGGGPFVLDGELLTAREVHVAAGPQWQVPRVR
jgi:diacylglycerol kinase family enzyme